MFSATRALTAVAATLALGATPARATWSIVLVDTRTGEVAVGSATCLTNFDLQKWTPVILTGVGAAAAQASVNGVQFANRTFIRDRLALGVLPTSIIGSLNGIDSSAASRQYGIVDVMGRAAVFTGPQANQWAGGTAGSFGYTYAGQSGTIAYSIQGNILTGSPVVQLALAAARDTPGDLPQRLMAAMEAARAAGGDGRCSCTGGAPTSCGAPPPSFTKSAHIGYMLIARAGDTDGSHGYYRAGSTPMALAAADFNGDGLPDIAAANSGDSTASSIRNVTSPAIGFPRLDAPVRLLLGATPTDVAIADITGDGNPDIVVAVTVLNRLSIFPGNGAGGFGVPITVPLPGAPDRLVIADFDGANGPDIAVLTGAGVSVLLNSGAGTLLAPTSFALPASRRGLIAADVTGDGIIDLVTTAASPSRLIVLRGDGAGSFTPEPDVALPAVPRALAAADLSGDGLADLAIVGQSSSTLTVLVNQSVGGVPAFGATSLPLAAVPSDVALGDLTGDGLIDAIVPVAGGRVLTFHGSAGGALAPAGSFDLTTDFLGGTLDRVILTDIDGDGDLDAAFAASAFQSIIIAENRGGGSFIDSAGTASGDYFMAFNVPNQPAGAPDPVFQLQSTFDVWRAAHVGRPDAVQSLVEVPTLIAGSGNTGIMTVMVRDWQGAAITAPVSAFTVERAGDGPAHVSVVNVANPAPGVYEITMAAGSAIGSDRFIITVDDGIRPVVLMPQPEVGVGACPADWNSDGVVNSNDISAFIAAWVDAVQGGPPVADFNGDGVINSNDVSAFLVRWVAAVTGFC